MTSRLVSGVVLTAAGAAGVTVCLASLSSGMRDVMQTDGGFCASGGLNVTGQCSAGDIRLVTVGMLGGLAAAAVYVAGTCLLGSPASSAGLLTWTALFGALGWNFVSLGLYPAAQQAVSAGWLFTGGMFWLLALSGLVLFLTGLFGEFGRATRRRDPVLAGGMRPLVRAAVLPDLPRLPDVPGLPDVPRLPGLPDVLRLPGLRGWLGRPGRTARGLARRVSWLAGSLAGTGLSLAVTSSLIGALR